MGFIDIFNFKKYYKNIGDGYNAKIGHVNELYNVLSASSSTITLPADETLTNNDINKIIVNDNGIAKLPVKVGGIPAVYGEWRLTLADTEFSNLFDIDILAKISISNKL
ncbi:MAG: hypothetical protein E6R13_08090 [Spirochaetes bacterium]|nr:MAG: hypothetical protein E6R13_08090 [Spirochaetota bacterium]